MRRLAAALLHFPVLDRAGQVVTTAITNLDLHDIARSSHTYGLSDFFIVHPIAAQRELALRVREHWTTGSGARRIPDRTPALSGIRVVETLDAALVELGRDVELWSTGAAEATHATSFAVARECLTKEGPPILILFGTGWGLAPEVLARCQRRLEPLRGARSDGYNHLSVRAAAAIIFDRLRGHA